MAATSNRKQTNKYHVADVQQIMFSSLQTSKSAFTSLSGLTDISMHAIYAVYGHICNRYNMLQPTAGGAQRMHIRRSYKMWGHIQYQATEPRD